MKRLFLSLLAVLGAAVATMGQSTFVATLSHDGDITAFYGFEALKEAYAKAENGDIITLSSGQFNAVDIAKAITIRGAGMKTDPDTKTPPTIIDGDFTISTPAEETAQRLVFEGIFNNNTITYNSNLKQLQFLKCRLGNLTPAEGCEKVTMSLMHCYTLGTFKVATSSNATCYNSIFKDAQTTEENTSGMYMNNCFLRIWGEFIDHSTFWNCVLISDPYPIFAEHVKAYNCLCVATQEIIPHLLSTQTNTTNYSTCGPSWQTFFISFEEVWNDDTNFELNNETKVKYPGADGKEVGIYGGDYPFDPIPSNPHVKKLTVAPKSDAAGKLSVEIQFDTAE